MGLSFTQDIAIFENLFTLCIVLFIATNTKYQLRTLHTRAYIHLHTATDKALGIHIYYAYPTANYAVFQQVVVIAQVNSREVVVYVARLNRVSVSAEMA